MTQWAAIESYDAESLAREPQVQPVHRLEEFERGAIDIGLGLTDPEDVGGRILPGLARRPACEPDPALDLRTSYPRTLTGPAICRRMAALPGVHPDHGGAQRRAFSVCGHVPRPLGRAPHAHHTRRAHR